MAKSSKSNMILFQGSVKLFDFNVDTGCKSLKTGKEYEILKSVLRLSGLRTCDDYKIGVRCYNAALVKYDVSKRLVQLVSHTAKVGDNFTIVDNISFDKGRKSCSTLTLLVRKAWSHRNKIPKTFELMWKSCTRIFLCSFPFNITRFDSHFSSPNWNPLTFCSFLLPPISVFQVKKLPSEKINTERLSLF